MSHLAQSGTIICSLEAVKAFGLNFTWFRDITDGGRMKYQAVHKNCLILTATSTPKYGFDERHTWIVYDCGVCASRESDELFKRLKERLEGFDAD